MRISINTTYNMGDMVYVRADEEQAKFMITGIKLCLDNTYLYEISNSQHSSQRYETELSKDKAV